MFETTNHIHGLGTHHPLFHFDFKENPPSNFLVTKASRALTKTSLAVAGSALSDEMEGPIILRMAAPSDCFAK